VSYTENYCSSVTLSSCCEKMVGEVRSTSETHERERRRWNLVPEDWRVKADQEESMRVY
jgi:hypothetical protein